MGAAIESERFERVDYDRFTERLIHSLAALARLHTVLEVPWAPAALVGCAASGICVFLGSRLVR